MLKAVSIVPAELHLLLLLFFVVTLRILRREFFLRNHAVVTYEAFLNSVCILGMVFVFFARTFLLEEIVKNDAVNLL